MIKKKGHYTTLILIILSLCLIASCGKEDSLEKIRKAGVITVVTRNNAHCYYTYRDNPCGFEYDLAKAFSDYLGVKLNVITPSWEKLTDALNTRKGDFIAASLSVSQSREKHVDFSDDYLSVQQKVILHKSNYKIKTLQDLNGKTIHVRRGTSYEERLNELKGQGLDINIILHDDIPTEEFIRMVAEKEIAITIADSNIALLNRRYYPDIKISIPIQKPQHLGWAVRKGNVSLLREINRFFKKIKKNGTLKKVHDTYYAHVEIFDYVDLKKFHIRLRTRLPKYRAIIQQAAGKNGFDWRFIAAVIYQESHFDPQARSYTGVGGLMQLTKNTAKAMGVTDRHDPEQSIRAGVRYLKKLYDKYDTAKDPDRLFIALASYNVGRGHILDAQKIAERNHLDPNSWASLRQVLPLLRYSRQYKKATHGYCRGTEPVRYVNRILLYYDILKRDAITSVTEQRQDWEVGFRLFTKSLISDYKIYV